jgi:hypothetical protein
MMGWMCRLKKEMKIGVSKVLKVHGRQQDVREI